MQGACRHSSFRAAASVGRIRTNHRQCSNFDNDSSPQLFIEQTLTGDPNPHRLAMATKEVPLWSSEAEIEQLLTQKRKAEEEMPYNSTEARKRARSIGIEEAANAMEEPCAHPMSRET